MNVIGNNLANVNTTAYKGNRVSFAEMLSQTVRGASQPNANRGGVNPIQYGLGVFVSGTDQNFEQGALNQTNKISDLAIQGNGFFITSNSNRMAFTRDGGLELDAEGTLVHRATGERIVGWTADLTGNIDVTAPTTPTSTINIPVGNLNTVQVTSNVKFAGNLDGDALPTDFALTQVRTYDNLGGAHDLTLKITNRTTPVVGGPAGAMTSWDWEVWEGGAGTGTLLASDASAGNEKLFFDASGNIVTALPLGTLNTATVPASGSAAAYTVSLDLGSLTQLKGSAQINATEQDGLPPGTLQTYTISQDGVITGIFTNGLTRPLAQIAMASFSNQQGLERIGTNLYRNTDNSGFPLIGTPRSSSRGIINTGFLEQSNVDISNEFTDLIVTQRGFQANTRVITTVDQMLEELVNIKR
jgi:flagellar hook protein FlgE